MGLEPKGAGSGHRIDRGPAPPRRFVPGAVHLSVVSATQWNGELIADLAGKGPALRKAQVVGIARLAAADQARLPGHILHVIAVPHPAGFREGQRTFVNRLRAGFGPWWPGNEPLWLCRSF
jgi:hypothetical protein